MISNYSLSSAAGGNNNNNRLLGRFIQSHNDKIIEVLEDRVIFAGKAYNTTWIEDHAFYFLYENETWWYYIRNGDRYEVIKYKKNEGYHTLDPI